MNFEYRTPKYLVFPTKNIPFEIHYSTFGVRY